jgi:hypothetical protein
MSLALLLGAGELTFNTTAVFFKMLVFTQAMVMPETGGRKIHYLLLPMIELASSAFELISSPSQIANGSTWTIHGTGNFLQITSLQI